LETDVADARYQFALYCAKCLQMTQSGHRASGRPLSVDDLGGVLLGINDRDYHNRISFPNISSGYYCRFFAAERTFYLSVHS